MNTRAKNILGWTIAILVSLWAAPATVGLASAAAASNDAAHGPDDAAITEVVAGFSNGWNTHDAHAMCVSLAENVQWVNWRGEELDTRQGVEEEHAKLFADLYKNTHRTDSVKSIHYVGTELAVVDDYWTMTGARKRDGSDWPYRAGLYTFLMAKRDGRWVVIASHAADFNAQAPTAK